MNSWQRVCIVDACESIIDCINKTAPKIDGPSPYKMIRTTNIRHGVVSLESVKYVTEETYTQWTRRQIPKRGDVLLTREAPMGEAGMLLSDEKVFLGQRIVSYRANPKKLDNHFLLYAFQSQDLQAQIQSYASGSTVQHMRVPDTKALQIPLPPLSEQRRIVAILDEVFAGIDAAIANTEKNLINAREIFESYLNKTFSQYGSLPTTSIGEVGEVFDGPHATPKTISSGPIFLGISALQDGIIKLEKTRHVSSEDFKKWTRRVEPRAQDIVFSYETRLGQAAIIPENLKCCLGRRMGLIRFDQSQIEPRYFLYLYLSPPYRQFLDEKTVHGATVDRISIKEFSSFPVPLIDMGKQKKIVNKVESFAQQSQKLEEIYQEKLTALNELKQSILQKAFTGQLTTNSDKILEEAEEAA